MIIEIYYDVLKMFERNIWELRKYINKENVDK